MKSFSALQILLCRAVLLYREIRKTYRRENGRLRGKFYPTGGRRPQNLRFCSAVSSKRLMCGFAAPGRLASLRMNTEEIIKNDGKTHTAQRLYRFLPSPFFAFRSLQTENLFKKFGNLIEKRSD